MKYREAILKKLDGLESNLSKLNLFLNRGDRENCREITNSLKEQIEQIKGYVESENIDGRELNKI